jgi:hypothetical protein
MKANVLKIISVISVLLLGWSLSGCGDGFAYEKDIDKDAVVKDIYVEVSSLSLEVGASFTIQFWPLPANADIMKLTWVSQNPEIATIDRWGRVSAVSAGTTTLAVSAGSVSKSVNITVTNPPIVPMVSNWLFDDPDDLAKVEPESTGKRLEFVQAGGIISQVDGPAANNKAVRIPLKSHIKVTHGIAPNKADGLDVYSILIVFKAPTVKDRYYTFLQTDLANGNDGDCFINKSAAIGSGSNYSTNDVVTAEKWYRLIISRNGEESLNYYLNGTQIFGGKTSDSRWTLQDAFLLCADEDGEDNEMDVAEVALWDVALTESQAHAVELDQLSGNR